ncbi:MULTISPECIES: hypothetical protein [unclassified Lentimonas]|uniref:hypothetical protein n=1 Tax=unclassified Lentimonas TaxID=2630993 RepID=UPI00132C640B|nr:MULTISPECIES: hypothetical protein [unclassified Lentimonas]CAA6679520.1 Unannotated [Lentimonas sp. CC4]CAA6687191.1 Unannotated [Lentimonas sp. CC6]CAA7075462.1 Unannotated [Lentimonas sp. CC4]CAA7170228.1 Unannotated [Lentimonas sp. CC21]CAA7182523.1 Unannotated [Lentimonas sp. CC8]
MKKTYFLLLCANLFLGASLCAETPEIKLSGSKDRVLAHPVRISVLDVAETYLSQGDSDFAALLKTLDSPYGAEAPEVVVAVEEQAPVAEAVAYDDASVLEAIGLKFAIQVRGTLEKGGQNYLQLQGGGLLKSGTSFPANIPEIKDQTFTITVSDISSRGYTLSMGTSTFPVSFYGSTGATKDSGQ